MDVSGPSDGNKKPAKPMAMRVSETTTYFFRLRWTARNHGTGGCGEARTEMTNGQSDNRVLFCLSHSAQNGIQESKLIHQSMERIKFRGHCRPSWKRSIRPWKVYSEIHRKFEVKKCITRRRPDHSPKVVFFATFRRIHRRLSVDSLRLLYGQVRTSFDKPRSSGAVRLRICLDPSLEHIGPRLQH